MNARRADEDLRAAWRTTAEDAPAAGDCPSPEEVWDAAHGRLDHDGLRRVLDHTARCGPCAEDWRLAVDVGAAEEEGDLRSEDAGRREVPIPIARPASPRTPSRRWWTGLAAAAVLAFGLGLGLAVQEWRQPDAPVYRQGGEAAVVPAVPDGAALPRDAFELRWEGPPGAVEYDLQVTTPDLRVVDVRRNLEEPRHQVPAGALAGLPDGTRLYWQVEATLESGDVTVSPTFAVEIAPGAPP